MRKKLVNIFDIVLKNLDTLLCFEIIYKMIAYSFLFPFIQRQLELIPKTLGVSHLGQQDIGMIFQSPLALIRIIGILLLLSYYLLFEITAILIYCEVGWKRERITFLLLSPFLLLSFPI